MEFMMFIFRGTGNRELAVKQRKAFTNKRKKQAEEDKKELIQESGAKTKKEKKQAEKQAARYPRQTPEEFFLFIRMMILVRGLCTQLDVTMNLLPIFEFHARRALIDLCPKPKRALTFAPTPATGLMEGAFYQ